MIEYTLLYVLILDLRIYCGPDKFYGRSKFGQYYEVKNRAPLDISRLLFMIDKRIGSLRGLHPPLPPLVWKFY